MSKLKSRTSKISGSGLKVTFVPRCCVRAGLAQRSLRLAALEALEVHLAVALDLDLEVFRERVHDRDADAVQAARDAVGGFVELAAGVQLRQHHLGRGDSSVGWMSTGYAAAVIFDRDAFST